MKVIVPTHGTVGVHVAADDVLPQPGLMMRDLIEFVAESYRFAVKPQIPANVAPFMVQNFVFQSGELISGDTKLPIVQLAIIPNGDIVTAATTDIADKILEDFMERLDATFGYRFASAEKERAYQSNVVVEFEAGVEEKIEIFRRLEKILEDASLREAPFKFKRLAFGSGDIQAIQSSGTIREIENSDFIIERRATEPYSRNRYFCSAPTTTKNHIKVLHEVEKAFR
jgi:hypothetical protein